jgi:beta-glucosidase
MTKQFPQGFTWGTATASFQIEGATREDGRGESIWDRFAATPGKIITGETGDPACESYHRYKEDIALMQEMNMSGYRFSIAWPRVIPDGDGAVNAKGLEYYDHVVDALLAAGITPYVTLYHWDLPQALQDKGGWANRATNDAFARYVDVTVSRLGDRVKHWTTFNEPWCVSILSNFIGEHAPGLHDRKTALLVAHNLLLAHGKAVPIIRNRCPDGEVSIVLNFQAVYPATDSEADAKLTSIQHDQHNRWFLDPIMGKGYPSDGWQDYGADVPEIAPGDMETISTPLDFLGVNYYSRTVYHDLSSNGGRVLNVRNEQAVSARNWEIFPQGLYDLLTWLHRDYDLPKLVVTENGMALHDKIGPDGCIHDPARIAFLKAHLDAILKAIDAGVNVRGYFCWTLMDNFEWAYGTLSRFGLAYTNFNTQERILKDSGHWYGQVARANAILE